MCYNKAAMDDQVTPPPPERNLDTQANHRRATLLQITLPLVIGSLLATAALIAVIVAAANGSERVGTLAGTSFIWLSCLPMLMQLICVAALAGMSYGLFRLYRVMPGFFYRIQNLFENIHHAVRKFTDALVEPTLKIQSFSASVRALRKGIGETFKKPQK
jgi:hypothetical protein